MSDPVGDAQKAVKALVDAWQCEVDERAEDRRDLVEVLTSVKYWFHDVLSLGRPVSDPRALLRRVEDILNELDPAKVEAETK